MASQTLEIVQRRCLWINRCISSKRDLVFNQVPIATKQALLNYDTLMKLLVVTKCKEESPYKPDLGLRYDEVDAFPHSKMERSLLKYLHLVKSWYFYSAR